MKADLYQSVTRLIVQQLEQGVRPWMQPWHGDQAGDRIVRPLRVTGQPYKGINVLMLWSAAMTKGYGAPIWLTFKQACDLSACPQRRTRKPRRLCRPHDPRRD